MSAAKQPQPELLRAVLDPDGLKQEREQRARFLAAVPIVSKKDSMPDDYSPGLYSGRFFNSATEAAMQYQYEARLRAANSRELDRFGPLHCAAMQRDAADLYAAARAAIAKAIGEGA